MGIIDYETEHYSLCQVYTWQADSKTYHKFYRVADYYPDRRPDMLATAVVSGRTASKEMIQAHPEHLYNPKAARNFESRKSDFYYFQWRPNPDEPGKQLTRTFYDSEELLEIKEPYEVIIPAGISCEEDLRQALEEGIPFEGKTTSHFYIVYAREGNNTYSAIRCNRKDYSFGGGLLRLLSSIANPRETALTAPKVTLEGRNIIYSPFANPSFRSVYAQLGELEPEGNVLLRPLAYYASDYVKWFVHDESIDVSKTDRKRLAQIADSAVSRPDALEKYLKAQVPDAEITDFRNALANQVLGKEDRIVKLFAWALLRDEKFYQKCVSLVAESHEEMLDAKKKEVEEVSKEIDDAKIAQRELITSLETLNAEKIRIQEDVGRLKEESESVIRNRDEVLSELQSNIALRLGLRAVSDVAQESKPQDYTYCKEGHAVDAKQSNKELRLILASNMKILGLTSLAGDPSEERQAAALGIIGALSATKFLAVPQAIASQIADALCISLVGYTAKRVSVPTDYRDVGEVIKSIADEDVVLLENVIDPVNEGVLFPLISANLKPIVIVSFMSHASALLLAKEVWGCMLLPMLENIVFFSRAKPSKGFLQNASPFTPLNISADDAFDIARALGDELEELQLSSSTRLLAATVLAAEEILVEEEPTESFVSQHLLMASKADNDSLEALRIWSEDDMGLLELAEKLGIDEF